VFEGPEDHIDEMVARCEDGPGSSRVDLVDFEWEEATGEFDSFQVDHY
jgi:acylphosphatase